MIGTSEDNIDFCGGNHSFIKMGSKLVFHRCWKRCDYKGEEQNSTFLLLTNPSHFGVLVIMPQKEIKQNHAQTAYFMTINLFHIEPKPNT